MRELTITRSLAEIKALDAKISRGSNQPFISVKGKSQQVVSGIKVEDLVKQFDANFKSERDMILERHKIKRAVVLSNATTKVAIGESEMTVAEAIDLKNTIQLDKTFLNSMRQQYNGSLNAIVSTNSKIDREAEIRANEAYGNKQKSDQNEYNKFVEDYKSRHYVEILDPNSLLKEIEKLSEYIDTFEMEVDFSLSESNALTKIEIN